MSLTLCMFVFVVTFHRGLCLTMIPGVQEYFPGLAGNLTAIEWSHAVNSQARLKDALADTAIQMLEADVIYGNLPDGSGPGPIMGHPPANTSDLSLEHFIGAIISVQGKVKKGMKLDFKGDQAYNESWKVLDKLKDELKFPVWLNADILKGPRNAPAVPLNAANFVAKAQQHLAEAPLSLGWTTAFEAGTQYSDDELNQMKKVIEEGEIKQPITLAVRAAFAALSKDGILKLVENIDKFQNKRQTTVTVWMSDSNDRLDIQKGRDLISNLGVVRVALDVPADIRDKLLAPSTSSPT